LDTLPVIFTQDALPMVLLEILMWLLPVGENSQNVSKHNVLSNSAQLFTF